MRRNLSLFLLSTALLFGGILLGRITLATEEAESPATVKALRYGTPVIQRWGIEHWIDHLYFPEAGVDCRVEFDSRRGVILGKGMQARPSSRPRDLDATPMGEFEIPAVPHEEVEVPRELAESIFALAELTSRQEKEAARLANAVVSEKLLRSTPPEGASSFRPVLPRKVPDPK